MKEILSCLLAVYLMSIIGNFLLVLICLVTIDDFESYNKASILFLGPIGTLFYLIILFLGAIIDMIKCAKGVWFNK